MNITENEKFNTGFQLHCEGKLKEAELIYNEILAVNPKNAQVLNLLGIIKLNSNKLDEAEKLITKAVTLKKEAYFYESLAKVYETKKDYECEQNI